MKKYFSLLSLLLLSTTQVFAASSAINFANVGNLAGYQGTDPAVYTPTITGFTSSTSVNFKWSRHGAYMLIEGSLVPGAVSTGVVVSVSLPVVSGGQTVAASDYPTLTNVGYGGDAHSSGDRQFVPLISAGASSLNFAKANSGTSSLSAFTADAWTAGEQKAFTAWIRINGWVSNGIITPVTVPRSQIKFRTGAGYGSTNTTVRNYANVDNSLAGSDAVGALSSTLGASVTVNIAGVYCASASDLRTGGAFTANIAVNNTTFSSSGGPTVLMPFGGAGGDPGTGNVCAYFNAGDVARVLGDSGDANTTTDLATFVFTKVSN